ncbi:MAG: MerC domain-containing protein [Bacteroidia bacterium]
MKHVHNHTKSNSKLGKLGVSLSVACSIHCLAMPFVVAAVPAAGSALHTDLFTEVLILGSSLLLSGFTLAKDYRQVHRQWLPLFLLALASLAIVFQFSSHSGHDHSHNELSFGSILGGVMIFAAYVSNWFISRRFHSCEV